MPAPSLRSISSSPYFVNAALGKANSAKCPPTTGLAVKVPAPCPGGLSYSQQISRQDLHLRQDNSPSSQCTVQIRKWVVRRRLCHKLRQIRDEHLFRGT